MRHFVFGLVILAVTGTLFQGVNGIACLSCERGLTDYESELSECSHIEECESDQVCFVEKFISETDYTNPKYRAGCRAVKDCKLISCSNAVTEKIPTHAPHVGKRAGDEIPLCSECCYSDMCNINGCNTTALEADRVRYHKRCFSCSNIVPEDNSTCMDMKWCEYPSEVCSITADPVRRQYNLGCEKKSICDTALHAHENNGAPLLLKCFDGHLKNFNPVSNHTDTFVADVLKCPTALVPANVTTAAPSIQASTTKRQTTTAIPPSPPSTTKTTTTTTTQTSTTSTTTAPSTSAKTSPTTTTPAPTPPIVTSTTTMATSTPTSTTQSTTQTPLPTLPTVKSTTPLAPTLPPRTSTSTLVPTSPDTNSPSLPTIPIITAIVTMAPTSQTTTTTTVDTTTSPDTTTSRPSTTITTPAATTSTPTTTNTQPPSTPTTTSTTTTTTTAKPPATPPPTTTTTPTTTPTTSTPTTTPTTTTPTTTPPTTTTPTTTPTTTTPTTTIRTTTNPPPPAGHTIAPNPTTCFVCIDDEPEMCDILYAETTCEPPNNYCINQVTNLASGDKLVNRTCGNFDRCFKDWYHGSSDKDVCQNFDENQYITLDFECVYCCVQDRCNEFMKPPIDTLYEDK